MKIINVDEKVSVSEQITTEDVKVLKQTGVEIIVCNRPDGEEAVQPTIEDISQAAEQQGIEFHAIPFASGEATTEQQDQFSEVLAKDKRLHAYCRSGKRSTQLYQDVLASRLTDNDLSEEVSKYDVVIVGAGSGGIATAASLHKRNKTLQIALIDPAESHYYQPGWTMVGGGVFDAESTKRKTEDLIPNGCTWIRKAVNVFSPQENKVELDGGATVYYEQLVVAPGLKLNWSAIEGLEETLGRNGVTSNYRFDLAPYTWELVSKLKSGKAIFTQPPMPIKCAGAPQKAMYLSASEWTKQNTINNIQIDFYNSGAVLFGVKDYVPALMKYIEKYNANLNFSKTLFKVDGEAKKAWFKDGDGNIEETTFDMLHVCPPQTAPDFIRNSELADDAGWLDVDPATLRSKRFDNVWGIGDVMNTANAKTMAAVRKQAPVVAHNLACVFAGKINLASYDGYGSCPLTVEHGKIVLAEFTYGGKVAPSFPTWLNDGIQATPFAWFLKEKMLPPIYWHAMLKGREWMASPVE